MNYDVCYQTLSKYGIPETMYNLSYIVDTCKSSAVNQEERIINVIKAFPELTYTKAKELFFDFSVMLKQESVLVMTDDEDPEIKILKRVILWCIAPWESSLNLDCCHKLRRTTGSNVSSEVATSITDKLCDNHKFVSTIKCLCDGDTSDTTILNLIEAVCTTAANIKTSVEDKKVLSYLPQYLLNWVSIKKGTVPEEDVKYLNFLGSLNITSVFLPYTATDFVYKTYISALRGSTEDGNNLYELLSNKTNLSDEEFNSVIKSNFGDVKCLYLSKSLFPPMYNISGDKLKTGIKLRRNHLLVVEAAGNGELTYPYQNQIAKLIGSDTITQEVKELSDMLLENSAEREVIASDILIELNEQITRDIEKLAVNHKFELVTNPTSLIEHIKDICEERIGLARLDFNTQISKFEFNDCMLVKANDYYLEPGLVKTWDSMQKMLASL